MTEKGKRILITTEKHEIFIVSGETQNDLSGLCERCGAMVDMSTLAAAVAISGEPKLELVRPVDTGAIPTAENENRHLLLCRPSSRDLCDGESSTNSD